MGPMCSFFMSSLFLSHHNDITNCEAISISVFSKFSGPVCHDRDSNPHSSDYTASYICDMALRRDIQVLNDRYPNQI